jgi:hypothetical protein
MTGCPVMYVPVVTIAQTAADRYRGHRTAESHTASYQRTFGPLYFKDPGYQSPELWAATP